MNTKTLEERIPKKIFGKIPASEFKYLCGVYELTEQNRFMPLELSKKIDSNYQKEGTLKNILHRWVRNFAPKSVPEDEQNFYAVLYYEGRKIYKKKISDKKNKVYVIYTNRPDLFKEG